MITVAEWTTIRYLKAQGMSNRAIARQLGISRNTVKKALERDNPPKYDRAEKPSEKVAAYGEEIERMLKSGFIGTRILRELTKMGYTGSQATLYRHLTKAKEETFSRATERYETLPGEQAQFDWSDYTVELGGLLTRVKVFSLTLGYSRRKFCWASFDETQGSVFEAFEEGFRYFGGTTKRVLVDNARCMVLDPRPGRFRWNPRFLELCGHYRVEPVAHKVGRAQTKGKVERPFFYLEEHFIKGNSWESFEHFCQDLTRFMQETDTLVHSTTQEIPLERFKEELPYLTPLPEARFVSTREEFRKVSWDCLISYGGSRYSVPHRYAGKQVWVRTSQGTRLEIYNQQGQLIASHQITAKKGTTVLVQEHYAGLRKAPKTRVLLEREFLSLFPEHGWFLDGLYAQYKSNVIPQLRSIVEMARIYPKEAFSKALDMAGQYQTYSHRFLEGVLQMELPSDCEMKPSPIYGFPAVEVNRDLSVYQKLLRRDED